jgi:LPS O-antigen subunit length determinant protein (WzzB/FepE family)
MHVMLNDMHQDIDDVFWHLPFSSKNQAKLVRQDNNIPEDAWNARRKTMEHRQPNARDELARLWKERIRAMTESGAISAAAGAGAEIDDEALPMEEGD